MIPLTIDGLERAALFLGVNKAVIWAIINVETRGCGFLPDKRPIILFERHIFHRLTSGKFDDDHPGVSNAIAGGYGTYGAYQYDRLDEAMTLDMNAALQSTSWGLGQIMGFNAEKIGYPNIQYMVNAFEESEDQQLQGLILYCLKFNLAIELQRLNWLGFASIYNGPDFHQNNYDIRLASAYTKFINHPPDLTVRAQQVQLYYKGFLDIGDIDGIMGPRTQTALDHRAIEERYVQIKRNDLEYLKEQITVALE